MNSASWPSTVTACSGATPPTPPTPMQPEYTEPPCCCNTEHKVAALTLPPSALPTAPTHLQQLRVDLQQLLRRVLVRGALLRDHPSAEQRLQLLHRDHLRLLHLDAVGNRARRVHQGRRQLVALQIIYERIIVLSQSMTLLTV